jgi:hypothetical protein
MPKKFRLNIYRKKVSFWGMGLFPKDEFLTPWVVTPRLVICGVIRGLYSESVFIKGFWGNR